ncbi:hypothetical protein ABR737_00530 [Streptomyces sp. Edi2]|uniref:hypothetical protein n=1 Tax=Streptomyces sp. Edi2 TaxID=3162528 RepID=UPI0033060851
MELAGQPLTDARLRAALAALGVASPEDVDATFLLGALLAAAESAAGTVDRTQLEQLETGFTVALLAIHRGDSDRTGLAWAQMLGSRINRTALELREAVAGDAADVASAAAAALTGAGELVALVHQRSGRQELASGLAAAGAGIGDAAQRTADLRRLMDERGML